MYFYFSMAFKSWAKSILHRKWREKNKGRKRINVCVYVCLFEGVRVVCVKGVRFSCYSGEEGWERILKNWSTMVFCDVVSRTLKVICLFPIFFSFPFSFDGVCMDIVFFVFLSEDWLNGMMENWKSFYLFV